jgi:hypothetical protein
MCARTPLALGYPSRRAAFGVDHDRPGSISAGMGTAGTGGPDHQARRSTSAGTNRFEGGVVIASCAARRGLPADSRFPLG